MEVFSNIIKALESGCIPKNRFKCEPNLGRRNLYPLTSKKGSYKNIKLRMNLLAYSDGKENIFNISKKINVPLKELLVEYELLLKRKLLKNNYY
jgi:aminopeptidase-like protein